MRKFLYNWGPVVFYGGFIYVLSSLPLQVPGYSDKLLHFFEYALLGFLAARAVLLSKDLPRFWGVFLGALAGALLGVLDEFHQSFVPGRQATLGDGIADAFGAVFGAFVFVYMGTWLYRSRSLYSSPERCSPGPVQK